MIRSSGPACQPESTIVRTPLIAYVIGFSRATAAIQPGISASGTSALLANVSGRLAKPVIGKNCEWLFEPERQRHRQRRDPRAEQRPDDQARGDPGQAQPRAARPSRTRPPG